MAANKSYDLPMGEKYMLTIREAAVYFGIGIKLNILMLGNRQFNA